jgi:hypothetical protein
MQDRDIHNSRARGFSPELTGTVRWMAPATTSDSRPGVVIRRSDLSPDQRQRRSGLWVTRVGRTIRDCARAHVDEGRLAAAFREAAERSLLTPAEAAELASRYGYLKVPAIVAARRRVEPSDMAKPRALPPEDLPEWELLLDAAARLQEILPHATLVGGTAAAIVARHRRSLDADHVIESMRDHFDGVLDDLEAAAGWRTNRQKRPFVIMGNLDGIATTVRNLPRAAPLETLVMETRTGPLRLPTPAEILRIKAWLVVDRNATRDFLDVAAISDHVGIKTAVAALGTLDGLYPKDGDAGAVRQQLVRQLSLPRPYDLAQVEPVLSSYKGIVPRWGQWSAVTRQCAELAVAIADALVLGEAGWMDLGPISPMTHRHLTGGSYDLARLDDLIENGRFADWLPVLRRVAREPNSGLAENIERLLARRDFEEAGAFWRHYIDHGRGR